MRFETSEIPMIIFLLLLLCFILINVTQSYYMSDSFDNEPYSNEPYLDVVYGNRDTEPLIPNTTGTGNVDDSYQQNLSVRPLPQILNSVKTTWNFPNRESIDNQLAAIKEENKKLKRELDNLTVIINKSCVASSEGEYVVNGWFVQFHNLIETPGGLVLSELLYKIYGAPVICFRVKEGYPFLGPPDKPMFFPKADGIGFKAMTVLKIPATGYYDFRILTDDGMRLYYQVVASNVVQSEKNVKSAWNLLIDAWFDQAEIWITSKKLYFNQNDLVLVRMDYYELSGYASACVKLRHHKDEHGNGIGNIIDPNPRVEEIDLPYKNTFCSLLWSEVPLLGFT